MSMFSKEFEEQQAEMFNKWLKDFADEYLKRTNPLHDLLTKKKLAEILGVSSVTIDKYIENGLPVYTVPNSKKQYFLESDIYHFLGIKKTTPRRLKGVG